MNIKSTEVDIVLCKFLVQEISFQTIRKKSMRTFRWQISGALDLFLDFRLKGNIMKISFHLT